MPRQYSPGEVVKVLEQLEWLGRPGRGDHVNFNKSGERYVITVDLGKREVPRGTFKDILNKLGMTKKEFDEVAREVL